MSYVLLCPAMTCVTYVFQMFLEQVKKLEMITDQQEDEISKIRDELDDAEDKMKGMQTTLDSGYQYVFVNLLIILHILVLLL